MEVIILDDFHELDDECRRMAKSFGARYVHSGSTKGGKELWRIPGFAFNIGSKLAKGDYIALSCAEAYHPQDTLSMMADQLSPGSLIIPQAVLDDRTGSYLNILDDHAETYLKLLDDGAIPKGVKMKQLDASLPFFVSVQRQRYIDVGGYDEDFTGVCWDDNDIVERLILSGCAFRTVPANVIHLFHPRHNYQSAEIKARWKHNKKIYDSRKGTIVRNGGREWGAFPGVEK